MLVVAVPKKPSMPIPFRRNPRHALLACATTLLLTTGQTPVAAQEWPQFRGAQASGIGDGHRLPRNFDVGKNENVRWRTPIPGLSHASPVVAGNRVFVVSAIATDHDPELKIGLYGAGDSADDMVEHEFALFCLNRRTGAIEWRRTAVRGQPAFARHTKATHANSTPVTDGERVCALFATGGLYCYSVEGELLWNTDLGALDVGPHDSMDLHWGFASSPIIAGGLVIVQADVKQAPFLAAFDLQTGAERWRVARDDVPGWATPTAIRAGSDALIVVNGCKHMGAYRLTDGAEVWRMAGGGGIPVPTPVLAEGLVYLTSNHRPLQRNHPLKPIFAVRADAAGDLGVPTAEQPGEHVAWTVSRRGTYMQTPIVYRDIAWFGQDNGVVAAFDAKTGEELYRERLGDGSAGMSASPVAGDGAVYFTNEEGEVFVVAAAAKFELAARGTLNEICMATPAIAEGTLLFRTRGHVVCIGEESQPERKPPNVVLLLADDAGYADFGFQEHTDAAMAGLTPHIDTIATGGARLTDFYMSAPVCSPSRAGLVTGRYQQRFGHECNIPPGYRDGGLPLDEATIADRMRALGYATACVGKWHLGYPDGYHPNARGFDWFYGCLQGSRSYWPYDEPTPHRVILDDRDPTAEEGYLTDRLAAAAARFIEEHADEPFFLFVSFTAPHGPLQAKPEDLAALAAIEPMRRRKYAGLVVAMDDAVGTVLDALRRAGVEERTLVVFTNDNGGQTKTGAINTPLRGAKGTLWEGGTRVPCCIRWPGVIEPGTVIDDPAVARDLLPTFVAAAGGTVDPEWQLDGIDLGPHLRGEVGTLPERHLFWRHLGSTGPVAVRRGAWKLYVPDRGDGGAPQLFDLGRDPAEVEDLARAHPDRVAALTAAIADWEGQLIEPRWGTGAPENRRRAQQR